MPKCEVCCEEVAEVYTCKVCGVHFCSKCGYPKMGLCIPCMEEELGEDMGWTGRRRAQY